jgi:demethylmenaquinone methyltransferase / 2-methoxy-6-polyprenyl-1,4-benzoquinol methylase
MGHPGRENRSRMVRRMFQEISGSYDFINRLITFGLDERWRRSVVKAAALPRGGRLLDLGTGTGGIARAALARDPSLQVTAADFSTEMMKAGRRRGPSHGISWCCADALILPFPDDTFDAVTSGYLMRNVNDVREAFREQARVVKPGGRLVCLDTSPSCSPRLKPLILFHLTFVIPLIGRMIARNGPAYEYLPASTRAFLTPEILALRMKDAGFRQVIHRPIMFGTQVLLSGIRSPKVDRTGLE